MFDAALASGLCSKEEAAADALSPGPRREEESVADVDIQRTPAQSLASADPGLRQEETHALQSAASAELAELTGKASAECRQCSNQPARAKAPESDQATIDERKRWIELMMDRGSGR